MERLMTLKEVAADLQVSSATAYRWVKSKKIPAIVIGRTIRFRKSDLEDFLTKKSE